MLSPKYIHVKNGNTIRPADDAINLADHADSVYMVTYFQAYQKRTDVGTPSKTADTNGLSLHHSDIDWALSWNHPTTCPKKNINIPNIKYCINAFPDLFLMI